MLSCIGDSLSRCAIPNSWQKPLPPLAFSVVVNGMDEGTYYERVQRIAHMMDVRTAFVSEESVERAVEVWRTHALLLADLSPHEPAAAR